MGLVLCSGEVTVFSVKSAMPLEFIRYACSSVAILGPTLKVRTMHRKQTSLVQGDMGDLCRQTCAQHKATYFALQKCQYLIPLLPDDKRNSEAFLL